MMNNMYDKLKVDKKKDVAYSTYSISDNFNIGFLVIVNCVYLIGRNVEGNRQSSTLF
mgnify:CR=1 FL=1